MAREVGPKCRLCRREGVKLFLKGARCYSPKCPIDRKGAVAPGQHGAKSGMRMSDYGRQLREKQKAKRLYGVLEKPFKNYFQKAIKSTGNTGLFLLQSLESRLDNVVYRLGLVPSRSISKQLVSHGHVMVNNRRMDIPSYQVKPNDIISLSAKVLKTELIKNHLKEVKSSPPAWLSRKAAVGKMERLPERKEIESEIDEGLIVEFYSR